MFVPAPTALAASITPRPMRLFGMPGSPYARLKLYVGISGSCAIPGVALGLMKEVTDRRNSLARLLEVRLGFADKARTATPATCGVAIDVP